MKGEAADRKRFTVALAGNPNCGKTTLFNALTGARAHVGNYSGVTVEKRSCRAQLHGMEIEFVDLPGVYSLSAITLDEEAARNFILHEKPDLIVNIVDAGNLESNLRLTTQLMEMGVGLIIALNMWDEAAKHGLNIDDGELACRLNAPIVRTVGHRSIGIDRLRTAIRRTLQHGSRHHHPSAVSYGPIIDREIEALTCVVAATSCNTLPPRWYAASLLGDSLMLGEFAKLTLVEKSAIMSQVVASKGIIRRELGQDSESAVRDGRLAFIDRVLAFSIKSASRDRMVSSNRIDDILTHRLFGYPIFLCFMWLTFQATFTLGKYPAQWIDRGVTALSALVAGALPVGHLSDALTQGVIGGVGSVLVFMPSIMILFLSIALLEDSGYMARAAFIMDRLMRTLGLHGKAFVPMLMGFGCSVPAMMATRTLESRRDRILTILLIPFTSCSARLSIYVLFAGAFFGANAGNVIFGIYLFGILVAALVGRLLRQTLLAADDTPFIIEFPPYRRPTLKAGLLHTWERGRVYLRKMGGVILLASVALWFLGSFPHVDHYSRDYDGQIAALRASANPTASDAIARLSAERLAEDVSHSFIGRFGHAAAPALQPLGFSWQMTVSLVSGFVAKEVVVSSLGVLYRIGDEVDETSTGLVRALRSPAIGITPLTALAFLVFVLLYTPCVSALMMVRREIGIRWMIFGALGQTLLAWSITFVIYRAGLLLGLT